MYEYSTIIKIPQRLNFKERRSRRQKSLCHFCENENANEFTLL